MTADRTSEKDKLTIITTHSNADFDAVGSLLAAHKLYPGSLVVFPGFHEKSMKNFIVSTMAYLFNMVELKSIDVSRIERLIIVDTRQASRIGELEPLLKRNDLEIHVYDHHPVLGSDIRADYELNRATGANVTMLVDLIREKNIEITPDEATVMCLGIYEDTGAFTYPSTTESDFMAAAFLKRKGASLTTIADLIAKEMDPGQIALLNEMIRSAVHYPVNGFDIVVTVVSCDDYIHDLAFLVQKMLRIENLNALFAIAQMKTKIYVAARSRNPQIDVGAIIRDLGGGGHGFAAAATIKDKTLVQTEHRVIELLNKHLKSISRAGDIMSSPAITAEADISCRKARQLLSRYNINALLVVQGGDGTTELLGYISRQVIEKALYHSLDEVAIREYMSTEFATVSPDADITEIQEKIIENKQRILPVIEAGRLRGVITRTDLLNTLIQNENDNRAAADASLHGALRPKTKHVLSFMKERLSPSLITLLRSIGEVAGELGYAAYVVGGFVRDLFLYRPNEDMDIVIEGNGIEFARIFAEREGARVNAYAKFGTAVIIFPDGFKIDVASARMEYYKFPAALPTVEMSSIKLDLYRRDFTINTLAISLNPGNFGRMIDFFGGQRDMKEKTVRILHNLSFVEDPTRVFRAIRFEQRFGFAIGKLTAGLIENAVRMDFFKRLSGRRVFSELCQILKENNPIPALIRLNEFNLLKVIEPTIRFDRKLIGFLDAARQALSWYDLLYRGDKYMKWAVYFLILIRHADAEKTREICQRFELSPRYQKIFLEDRLAAEESLYRMGPKLPAPNSFLYNELSGFRTEILLYMMAVTYNEAIRKAISSFVTDLKDVTITVKGNDLKQMGLKPSPLYGKILRALLAEKLDGHIRTHEDEIEFIRSHAQHF